MIHERKRASLRQAQAIGGGAAFPLSDWLSLSKPCPSLYPMQMPFWVYMLHCNGGGLYVGHTDNLERRLGQHEQGAVPGFTADHPPVKLIWSDYVETREEAKAFEARLKGWSRAKKLALVRGDWTEISRLAKNPQEYEGQAFDKLRQSDRERPALKPIG